MSLSVGSDVQGNLRGRIVRSSFASVYFAVCTGV